MKAALFADDDCNVFREREEYSASILSQLEDAWAVSDGEVVSSAIAEGLHTRAEIQERSGFSQSKTINVMRAMVESGAVVKEGGSRSIRYYLADLPGDERL